MASVALSEIFPYVLAELPAAPSPLVVQMTAKVIDEFCRTTKCWVVEEQITVADATPAYALTTPSDGVTGSYTARLTAVVSAFFDGKQLVPTTRELLFQSNPSWQSDTGNPDQFTTSLPQTVELYPLPDAAAAGKSLLVRAAWGLLPTATTWDVDLFERHKHIIAAGVKANMMSMQGQAWTNPAGAMYYVDFSEGMRNERIDAQTGHQVRNQKVRMPRFA